MKITNEHVFFWGNQDVFSNWYPVKFRLYGQVFANSEQAMMYAKACLMGDQVSADAILKTSDPRKAKAIGRKITPWNEALWVESRMPIMVEILSEKFSNSSLKAKLLATGDKKIVEASPYDKIWGIGMGENDPGVDDSDNWDGLNLLGEALMIVREKFK